MKKNLTLITLLLTAAGAYGQHISEQQAMERALKYLDENGCSALSVRMAAPVRDADAKPVTVPVGAEQVYAFNLDGGGCIIASADSRTLPVLGYSTTGSIDWERMPENLRIWFRQYDDAIATLGNRMDFKDGKPIIPGKRYKADSRSGKTPVEPLIKTRWNEYAPYGNNDVVFGGDYDNPGWEVCPAGPAAVALAQVLNYWQWPKSLPNGVPEYEMDCYGDFTGTHFYNDALPPMVFDWDNMLDDYIVTNPETGEDEIIGTKAQQKAVANLIQYCGHAMKTQYYPTVSPTNLGSECEALNKYFGYSAAKYLRYRKMFSIDEWEEIIYNELEAGRPVLYEGLSNNNGTFFICDGYDGNGLFHINWGMGGEYDGYYSLSVLNPYESHDASTGSGCIGYSFNQYATVYIDPTLDTPPAGPVDIPHLRQYENIQYSQEDNIVRFSFVNLENDTIINYHALGTISEDGQLTPIFMGNPNDSIIMPFSDNTDYVKIDSTIFQPGESLTLYPMYRSREPGSEWQTIPPLYLCVVAGRNGEGLFYMDIHGIPHNLECTDIAVTKGTGRLGTPCDLTVTLMNHADIDYSHEIWAAPMYAGKISIDDITEDTPYWAGDWIGCGAYIKAGQEGDVTFSFEPQQGGLIGIYLVAFDYEAIGGKIINLDDDTLYNYDDYVGNISYISREDDQWFYKVELCGIQENMPHWIPSDSIGLKVCIFRDDILVDSLFIRDEIREYLTELPNQPTPSDYRFTFKLPVDISLDGTYLFESFLTDWYDGEMSDFCCHLGIDFTIANPTDVKATRFETDTEPGIYYDLVGRRIEGMPQKSGVYINDERKVIIK